MPNLALVSGLETNDDYLSFSKRLYSERRRDFHDRRFLEFDCQIVKKECYLGYGSKGGY